MHARCKQAGSNNIAALVECSFEFLYKQAVSSTDAFLGIMDKDASSACCEDLDLRIDLPNANSLSGKTVADILP